ncbi:MAG: glycosyltransferase family 39 protein [Bryobacterales bacterium]|nr:glycosyltransferase family 39 protein [Bryobacterales bacterium]
MQERDSTGSSKPSWILASILLLICVFALFWRLDATYLWRDEATTANWARIMVRNHSLVPLVFDGKTLVAQGFDAHDFNEHLTPGMQGWLQFYVTAISFQLFGVSTFTARLPFAIVGLLAAGVLWLIGRRLYPRGNLALFFPLLAISSIWFLTAFRQARYYGLVFLFGALLLYEFLRYLQDRDLVNRISWYLRISAWSSGIYLSNYLGFAGMYTALCIYVLLLADRKLFFRWTTMTVILAVLFGAEFFAFHFDFASSWGSAPQPWENPDWTLWDKLVRARNLHSDENFRMLPLLFLIPGLFYLFHRRQLGSEDQTGYSVPWWTIVLTFSLAFLAFFAKGTAALTWLSIALTFALTAVALRVFLSLRRRAGVSSPGANSGSAVWLLPVVIGAMVAFGLGVDHVPQNLLLYLFAELLVAGLVAFAVLRLRPRPGRPADPLGGLALLAILVIALSVAVTIVVGLDKGLPRYYYQVLAAGIVLAGMVVAELFRRGQRGIAVAFLVGFVVWPNISFHVQSSFAIVSRQFLANKTIDYPVVEFLREHAKPGDRVVFFRNVQGMMVHFYLPELDWVGQLDANDPRAIHFRDRLPDTAYDTVSDVDWYVVWDNYQTNPKGLDENYEKVWDYTYRYMLPWWDSKVGAKDERRWRIYRRKTAPGSAAVTTGEVPPAV